MPTQHVSGLSNQQREELVDMAVRMVCALAARLLDASADERREALDILVEQFAPTIDANYPDAGRNLCEAEGFSMPAREAISVAIRELAEDTLLILEVGPSKPAGSWEWELNAVADVVIEKMLGVYDPT